MSISKIKKVILYTVNKYNNYFTAALVNIGKIYRKCQNSDPWSPYAYWSWRV